MALDISTGYSSAFKTFVEFAEKTRADGYDSACARATLSDRQLTVSALSLHETSYVLRKAAEKEINNSTRALFKNAIADMFGGDAKIPPAVKKAMLTRDYDKGSPLTARRIIAVKNAIDADGGMRLKGASQFREPETREAALVRAGRDAGLTAITEEELLALFSPDKPAGKALADALKASPVAVSPKMLQSLATGVLRPYENEIKNGTAPVALSAVAQG